MAEDTRRSADLPTLSALGRTARAATVAPMIVAALAAGGLWLAARHGALDAGVALTAVAIVVLAALGASVALGVAFARRVRREVLDPLARVRWTLERVTAGDLLARAGLDGTHDLARIAATLDELLEYRIRGLETISRESGELNDSVVEIMRAVGTIATTKDLTIRVPVTDDVTGAIADALNLLTDETRRVLSSMRETSHQVAQATDAVRQQSERAGRAASRERAEVELAARELESAAVALDAIAQRARAGDAAAERAMRVTDDAVRGVSETARAVERSRALIHETEKRIKRLGERSQEIGQVVSVIQDVAERTGILALNAAMRALAAGDAGRSFAAVADEVKRLSESARTSTREIATLVAAIQAETGETVHAMSEAIARVVEISRVADAACEGMTSSRDETASLAGGVRDIARTSEEQARAGGALVERARIIQEASAESAEQLSLQSAEIDRLVECARALLEEVQVFRLAPESPPEAAQ